MTKEYMSLLILYNYKEFLKSKLRNNIKKERELI
jgi:hypothetical protein